MLKNIRVLEPLVKDCIPIPKKLYERAKRAGTLEEVEEYFPGFKAFIDATEQEIPRPKDTRKRRSHYSGKNFSVPHVDTPCWNAANATRHYKNYYNITVS